MELTYTNAPENKPKYLLVYGFSGLGKTTLAKTLPHDEVLILDSEGGLSVLSDVNIASHALKRVPEEKRFAKLQEFLKEIQKPELKAKFKYIFVDSLTELTQNIEKYLKLELKLDGFKFWGEYTNIIVDLVKFFRDLDHYTVIFTALEERIDDEAEGTYCYGPSIGGKKAKSFLMPNFDIVMRMLMAPDGSRKLVTKPTPKTQAKDRSGVLLELEEPNLATILEKVRKK